MSRTRVAVLRGGPSNEYDISLKTGKAILDNLNPDLYEGHDIFIDKSGTWHKRGIPLSLHDSLRDVDVVVNALHGKFGEDGRVQQLLDLIGIPYTGSGALGSALGMNKLQSKKIFYNSGIRTPYYKTISVNANIQNELIDLFRSFPQPSVIKPVNSGSSIGVSIVRTLPEMLSGASIAFEHSPQILIEEFIPGKEGSIGIIENFRGKKLYPLFPIEIRPKGSDFFDYKAKYSGESDEICPGNFSHDEIAEIEKMAILAHEALHLRHYSRIDFIVNPKRGVYILEANTLPGLTEQSLLTKALHAVGVKLSDFLHHIIELARK